MANTLRFKRGLASGIPTALAGEPLFTTDTFDLYIGNGTTNTRFQKYIASGATTQILRGDGSLYTFPLAISSPTNGQVLKYNGTSWVNDSDSGITGSGSSGQVAYFTGATTQAGSNNLFWDNTNVRLGVGTNNPAYTFHALSSASTIGAFRQSGAALGQLLVGNTAGDLIVRILATGDGLISSDTGKYLALGSNGGTERARIFATGNFGIGTGATDSGQKLQVVGTTYFSDSVGIGSTSLTARSLVIARTITGATSGYGILQASGYGSDVTANAINNYSQIVTTAATYTLTNAYHFYNADISVGAGSTITNQFVYFAGPIANATNNYGFYGNIASAANRWNLYMNGTANNYMAGSLGIGSTSFFTATKLQVSAPSASGGIVSNDTTSTGSFVRILGDFSSQNLINWTNGTALRFASSTSSFGTFTEHARFTTLGNLHIGTFSSDSGEKLQVTGTMKVTGASSFGGTITIARGQDANVTNVNINSGVTPVSAFQLNTDQPNTRSILMARNGYSLVLGTQDANRVTLDTSGNLAVDTNTLFVDATNNLVGVGTASPSYKLDVQGTVGTVGVRSASNTANDILYYATGTVTGSLNAFTTAINATGSVAASLQNNNTVTGSSFLDINVPSASTGDPYLSLTTSGATNWSVGIDNSDSDKLKIGPVSNPSLAGANTLVLHTNGNISAGSTTDSGERFQVTGTAKITNNATFNSKLIVTNTNSPSEYTITAQSVSTFAFGSTNGRRLAIFSTTAGDKPGIQLGFDSTDNTGIIAGSTDSLGSGIDFYTVNGGTWGNRMRLSKEGNLTVDTNTLFVDATNNRVGIGTNVPNSVLQVVGSVSKSISDVKTANYTATATDYTILCSAASGAITITLPAASGIAGRIYVIKKINASSGVNSVTVDGNASETIDGSATINLSCKSSVTLQCDGSNWHILSLYTDTSCL